MQRSRILRDSNAVTGAKKIVRYFVVSNDSKMLIRRQCEHTPYERVNRSLPRSWMPMWMNMSSSLGRKEACFAFKDLRQTMAEAIEHPVVIFGRPLPLGQEFAGNRARIRTEAAGCVE